MAYLLDADVFIDAKNHHYRFKVCPAFWEWLCFANSKGKLISIKEVYKELIERGDMLSNWCKPRSGVFVDTGDGETYGSLQLLATWVNENYEQAAQNKFFRDADFVLVGFAHAHKHTIVTHEVEAHGYDVKIPNACKALGVPVINPFQMLADEGVKFVLAK
jgi:hypothetical protein